MDGSWVLSLGFILGLEIIGDYMKTSLITSHYSHDSNLDNNSKSQSLKRRLL